MARVYPFLKDLTPLEVPLSLYLHVPFCRSKCGYCDFYSRPEPEIQRRLPVLRGIAEDLQILCDALSPPTIASVYIGGGTPNSLTRMELELLLSAVYRELGRRGKSSGFEWTVEINPELLTREQLTLMASYGVNRLSMGIQSFSNGALAVLGRRAGSREIERALTCLSSWKGDFSLDLIIGLPGRSPEEELADVHRTLSCDPVHLSIYALAVEEGTPLAVEVAAGHTPTPDEEEAARSLNAAADACRRAGYRHYEISNYARPGHESRHNLRYWRLQPYLGVGPSAASTLPGRNGPLRLTGGTTERGYSAERVEPEAFLLEHVMMGLRTAEGISRRRFAEIFGMELAALMPRSISRFTREGLLQTEAGRLQPTEKGMMLLDHLLAVSAAEIDEHLPPPEQLRLQWPLPYER